MRDEFRPEPPDTPADQPKPHMVYYPPDDGSRTYQYLLQSRKSHDNDNGEQTIEFAELAIAEAQKTGAVLYEIWALCMKATSQACIGLRTEGLESAQEALQLAVAHQDKALEARAIFAAAFVALESNDISQAETLLEKSLVCAEEAKSEFDLFWALNNLTHIHGETAQKYASSGPDDAFQKALQTMQDTAARALDTSQRTGFWTHRGYALLNSANAHILSGEHETAHRLIAEYAALARANDSIRLMSYANLDEARLLALEGEVYAAIAQLEDPEHFEKLCVTDEFKLRTHEALADLYAQLEDHKTAFDHLKAARAVERHVWESQSKRHINVLTARLGAADAKAEAQRLQLEAEALSRSNKKLRAKQEKLRNAAMLDSLTGLGNRRAADSAFDTYLGAACNSGRPFQVAYVDLDHFKSINDRFGHKVGDLVLSEVGQILQNGLRPSDHAFRYGGEEFVIILGHTRMTAGREACERLRNDIKNFSWSSIHPDLNVTASFGLARWMGSTDVAGLLSRADAALYTAKAAGRDRVVLS